jgi:hypothetical protein
MDNITIGYLSWKRHNVLNQTLKSHQDNGLFDLIKKENRIIFFQEIDLADTKIACKYNCSCIGNKKNIGILNAFIELVANCKTEYFIFCENDFILVEDKNTVEKTFEDSIKILSSNKADIIRLRHTKNPGDPLYSKPANYEHWIHQDQKKFPYKLESIHWLKNPNQFYNNLFEEYNGNYKWYITTIEHQKWSNNIFLCKTSYLKNIVIPLINHFVNKNNKYSGLEDVLTNYKKYISNDKNLNKLIESYSNTKIASGEGLFSHKDYYLDINSLLLYAILSLFALTLAISFFHYLITLSKKYKFL